MKQVIIGLVFAAFACFPAEAQETARIQAQAVANCGTQSLTSGVYYPVTQDLTGTLCAASGGSGTPGLPVNNPTFTGTLTGPLANITTSVTTPTLLGSPAGGALSLGADASHNGLIVTPSDAGGNAAYLTPGGVDTAANLFIGSKGSTSTVNISGSGLSLLSETPTLVVSGVTGQDSYVLINGSTTPVPIVGCGGASCGLSLNTSAGQSIVLPTATHNANVVGALTVGSATSAAVASGEVAQPKIAASGTAPGTGSAKFLWVAGTNAATCKLISYAGTSTTPVTIVDNVGAGC